MKKLALIFSLISLFYVILPAQVFTPEQAWQELVKRGLKEEDVRQRLLLRGIDLDNVDPNAADLPAIQKAIEEVILELEKEKKSGSLVISSDSLPSNKQSPNNLIPGGNRTSAGDIQLALERGASPQEAVSEILSEIQQDSLTPVKIFGQEIFRDQDLGIYRQSDRINPPDNYLLGPGDQLAVSIWGLSQASGLFEISTGGYIQPAGMGRIFLKGLSFAKAKELLRNRYNNYYSFRPEEFEVTISYARTLTVNIVGEVFNPGSFTISAVNTAINALTAAGGPTDIGSLRKITLKRSGEKDRILDVYKFLLNPSEQEDLYLQENDFLFVPVSGRVVAILGAIKRPLKYELIAGENLKQLIDFAGGLNENAVQKSIQVKRYSGDEELLIDVNLRDIMNNGGDFELMNGDVITVKTIPRPYQNFVEVEGAVELPGKYAFQEGYRLNNLVEKALLVRESRTDLAYLQRKNPNGTIKFLPVNIATALANPAGTANILLEPEDRLIVFSQAIFSDRLNFSVDGAVRKPQDSIPFDVSRQLRISDAVEIAGGLRPDATDFAYIVRTDLESRKLTQYIRVDLKDALENPNSESNLVIQPLDKLTIYSNLTYTDDIYVQVDGLVRNPGRFSYDPQVTLRDVLTLAGGLRFEAAFNRIDLFRTVIENSEPTRYLAATLQVDSNFFLVGGAQKNFALEPFDQVVVRRVPDFDLANNMLIEGEVIYPGIYALLDDNERLLSVLRRAGGITKEGFTQAATLYRANGGVGYLILDLEEVMKNPASPFNYILKEGDVLTIPKMKEEVSITGRTKADELYSNDLIKSGKINVPYFDGKNARWYVEEFAAGIGDKGQSKLITVEHPNGELEKTKNFGLFKVYPTVRKGSVITVGKKPEKPEEAVAETEKEQIDWAKVVANSIAQATGIISLILLIQRIN